MQEAAGWCEEDAGEVRSEDEKVRAKKTQYVSSDRESTLLLTHMHMHLHSASSWLGAQHAQRKHHSTAQHTQFSLFDLPQCGALPARHIVLLCLRANCAALPARHIAVLCHS